MSSTTSPASRSRAAAEPRRRNVASPTAASSGRAHWSTRSPTPVRLRSSSPRRIYGARGDEILTEESPLARGFLADVCRRWEDEAAAIAGAGRTAAMLRIGIVLAPDGGALASMLPIFRLGLGGRLGSGRQWTPWIHVDDVVRLLLRAGADPALAGPINAVAPVAATNASFTRALGDALRRPAFLPAPALALVSTRAGPGGARSRPRRRGQ